MLRWCIPSWEQVCILFCDVWPRDCLNSVATESKVNLFSPSTSFSDFEHARACLFTWVPFPLFPVGQLVLCVYNIKFNYKIYYVSACKDKELRKAAENEWAVRAH